MAEHWIIRVEGKDYGPADLETLYDWKADGRVLAANPARRTDLDDWQTAGEIPGLFGIEPPPVQVRSQRSEIRGQKSDVGGQRSDGGETTLDPPSRNALTETFRIYFRGFFQFLGLSLLLIVPIVCAQLTKRFIDAAPVNTDVRTLAAGAFGSCMTVVWLVLWPVYIAGIQILTTELATRQRIGFFSVLNGAVKYWPRVAGLGIFVFAIYFLLTLFGLVLLGLAAIANTVLFAVIVLGLLALQVWLFVRFFIRVLFWQQFAVLENRNATDALRESRLLARSGHNLAWYQRPLWRGALIFSLWLAFVLVITIAPEWQVIRDFSPEILQTKDPQALYAKMTAAMQPHALQALAFTVVGGILRPLLGIAFVVLYLDARGDTQK
jgi:hypothetical protein